jgi:hypothetical protein
LHGSYLVPELSGFHGFVERLLDGGLVLLVEGDMNRREMRGE